MSLIICVCKHFSTRDKSRIDEGSFEAYAVELPLASKLTCKVGVGCAEVTLSTTSSTLYYDIYKDVNLGQASLNSH